MKETLTELQGEINDSIFIVGDFNMSWLLIDQADQNIMNIEDPNDTIVIPDLMDIKQFENMHLGSPSTPGALQFWLY